MPPPIRLRGGRDAGIVLEHVSHALRNHGHAAEVSLVRWDRTAPFDHCVHVRIADRAIALPVVRGWPLLDLGPAALSRQLDALRSDMRDFPGFLRTGRQTWGERHATTALVLHADRMALPEQTLMEDDTGIVEFRLDHHGDHVLWCNPWEGAAFPLAVGGSELERVAGELAIMCEAEDGEGPDGERCLNLLPLSDAGNGILVNVTMPAPMVRMRMIADMMREGGA